jgi:hypothetical protein
MVNNIPKEPNSSTFRKADGNYKPSVNLGIIIPLFVKSVSIITYLLYLLQHVLADLYAHHQAVIQIH